MAEFANSLGTGGGGGVVHSHCDGFESAQLNELSLRNWSNLEFIGDTLRVRSGAWIEMGPFW